MHTHKGMQLADLLGPHTFLQYTCKILAHVTYRNIVKAQVIIHY